MGRESNLWNRLRRNMRDLWGAPQRHEDSITAGIADVSFACGGRHHWMELKYLDEWPKRATTVVRVEHFTNEQRSWLRAKGEAAGDTWMLLQVEDELLLFDWQAAVERVGHATREELISIAAWTGGRKADYQTLAETLARGNNEWKSPQFTLRGRTRRS